MKSSRLFAAASITVLLATAAPTTATAVATSRPGTHSTATGTRDKAATAAPHQQLPGNLDECSAAFFDGDPRLGPAGLPVLGIVGVELIGYHRTGRLSPAAFLTQYYSPTANGGAGGWIYPPANGFVIGPNGQPVEWQERLRVGQRIDRYGSEFGGREPHPRRARVRERAVAARQRLSGARRLTFAGRRTGLTEAEKGRGPAHTVPAPTSHGRLRSAVGRLPRQSSP